jgi:ATPase subunit of ABC transporter with duplicated ATPase domains
MGRNLTDQTDVTENPWREKWTSQSSPRAATSIFGKLSMPAFLVLDSISLATPDGRPLFDGLTLAVGSERTGLVGRNGSGKSSLLRLISGEIEPAGGSVQRIGSVGMLAQLADKRLTVEQALGVAAGLVRLRRLERGEGSLDDAAEADWTLATRIQAALVEAGLPSLPLDRPIASLSGGERTRVALARLLIEAPDVLLLDEPTNNLDPASREEVLNAIRRYEGAIVLVTHDEGAVHALEPDRVLILPDGVEDLWSPDYADLVALA